MKTGQRGQVTIPSALRETLGRMPGIEGEVEMGDDSVFLRLQRQIANRHEGERRGESEGPGLCDRGQGFPHAIPQPRALE